jgi:hypothetical protein
MDRNHALIAEATPNSLPRLHSRVPKATRICTAFIRLVAGRASFERTRTQLAGPHRRGGLSDCVKDVVGQHVVSLTTLCRDYSGDYPQRYRRGGKQNDSKCSRAQDPRN